MTIKPGSRVVFVDPEPGDVPGTVYAASAEEIAYRDEQYPHAAGWVLVRFDGDEEWDKGWYDPDSLRVLDDDT